MALAVNSTAEVTVLGRIDMIPSLAIVSAIIQSRRLLFGAMPGHHQTARAHHPDEIR